MNPFYDIVASGMAVPFGAGAAVPFAAAGADMLVGADPDFRALAAAAGADPFEDLGAGMSASGAYDIIASGAEDFDPMTAAAGAEMLIGAQRIPTYVPRHNPLAMAMWQRQMANRMRPRIHPLQQLAALGARSGTLVERGPTKLRKYPMGFKADADTVAGATTSVVRRPQVPIKLERLVVSAGIADSFEIIDVKIGKNSQLVSNDPIPGDAFAPGAFQIELAGDTANVGHDILILASNYSGAPKRFRAAIIGTSVE